MGEASEVPRPAQRRTGDLARVDRIFGEVLPPTTRDEWEVGSSADRDGDQWWRSQIPPHHGAAD